MSIGLQAHASDASPTSPSQLVIRNTFLELYDDEPALGPAECGRRTRALTDGNLADARPTPQADLRGRGGNNNISADVPDLRGAALPALSEVAPQGAFPLQQMSPASWQYAAFGEREVASPYPGCNSTWMYQEPSGKGASKGSRGVVVTQPQDASSSAAGLSRNRKGQGLQHGEREIGSSDTARGVQVGPAHTTVMLRNLPNRYTQYMLLTLLDEHGFERLFDFVYLPMDFRNGVNLGYAFVNLLSHQDAVNLMKTFHGFTNWSIESAKVCEVSWAHPHQGLQEHIERYRNSPVMHPSMPDEYKPMVFKEGERIEFPMPTKAIRAPKLRPVREKNAGQFGGVGGEFASTPAMN